MTKPQKLKKGDVVLLKKPKEVGWLGTWKAVEVLDPDCDSRYPDQFVGFPLTIGYRRDGWNYVRYQSVDPRCYGQMTATFKRKDVRKLTKHQPINSGV